MTVNIHVLRVARRLALLLLACLAASKLPAQACPAESGAASNAGWAAYREGRMAAARERFARAAELCAHNLDALNGLGYVALRTGELRAADSLFRAALARNPGNGDAQTGLGLVSRRRGRGPVEASAGWSNDSDDNTTWWQTLGASAALADAVRAFASAGAMQASDPMRDANRLMAEGGLRFSTRRLRGNAAGGARRLSLGSSDRVEPSYRAGLGVELAPSAWVGASFAHHSFDETAQLIGSGIDIDALGGSFDIGVDRDFSAGVSGGLAWLTDGNERYAVSAIVTRTLARRFFIGAMARQMGYDLPGIGYFSPDRFRLAEGRAGWSYGSPRWTARLSGGLGVQQARAGASTQAEWHAEVRFGRGWGRGSVVEVFGGISNSLESSATGAFRHRTAGVRAEIGL